MVFCMSLMICVGDMVLLVDKLVLEGIFWRFGIGGGGGVGLLEVVVEFGIGCWFWVGLFGSFLVGGGCWGWRGGGMWFMMVMSGYRYVCVWIV